MQIKNSELVMVGNFLAGLTLPAKVSRARTKLIPLIQARIEEYNESRQDIIKDHNGITDTKTNLVNFKDDKENAAAISEINELENETALIQPTYKEQFNTLKAYFGEWNGEVSSENANAYNVFFDALELEEENK